VEVAGAGVDRLEKRQTLTAARTRSLNIAARNWSLRGHCTL